MITTLHIKNIGIIDELDIELGKGFNVFTGETGAGKTLIIDALNIICGGRFSKEMIRKGENYSFVELNLYLPENKNAIENNIIVSREIHSNGKNSCKINGRLVTVTELKEFMSDLIDIHGQNDNQKILNSNYHIKYLDEFGEEELEFLLIKCKKCYQEYCKLKKELEDNLGDEKEKQRQLDLLQYEFDEIDKAKLVVGEEEKLKEKSLLFENAEKIAKNINETSLYSNNAVDNLNRAIKSLEKIGYLDCKYEKELLELKNVFYELEEFSRDISYMNEDIEFNTNERDEIEERLDLISLLERKYGNSIEEILEFKENIEQEINRINNLEEHNNIIRKRLSEIENEMNKFAVEIHNKRMAVSSRLIERINGELVDLEMPNARFDVSIRECDYNKNGKDIVQFLISTNIGEDKKELQKVASGGEMSRIMLAIKTVLANSDSTPIMIFDEIDTGISGKAAKSVSQKLKLIGNNHQVICITHQPSIAAKGNHNYFISKKTVNNRTTTNIKKLSENETLQEIARISNGDITEIAVKHAMELRKMA
ncbi:MAG: DNA repair protein RecN [Clostridia bacterium]|nr:DNA repair protein RecN [Clostridia bacterium]